MKNKFSLNSQIFIGAVAGVLIGIALNYLGPSSPCFDPIVNTSKFVGNLFVNLLKMVLIPLIFTSIAVGISNLQAHAQMHRVWKYTMGFFLTTPVLAVSLGLLVVNWIKPGVGLDLHLFDQSMSQFSPEKFTFDQFMDKLFSGLFVNPFEAMSTGNVLGTVMFAIFLGIGLIRAGRKASTVLMFLTEFYELIMMIVSWVMRIAPIGIMALLIKLIASQNVGLLATVGKFIAVVIGATLFHGIVVLPGLLYLVTRYNPVKFFSAIREPMITALSTSSSSATMPVTMRCVTENLKVDKNIAGFVIPLGTTVNMDGTALYEAMAALFVANLAGIHLSLAQQIIVALMSMIASIGAPGIPSAGMVTMVMVLQSVGLPVEAIAILLPIDRPLDAVRTMVNVEGDAVGSLIVSKLTSK